MQKIVPFLWFDGRLEEAVHFYTGIFKNAKIERISPLEDGKPNSKPSIKTASFELDGVRFMGIDAGPMFQFSPAISFFVHCEDQVEVDHLWNALSAGGEEQQCGWLKDPFGISWQIVPNCLGSLLSDPNPLKSKAVMQALLKMKKIDIKTLEEAHRLPS